MSLTEYMFRLPLCYASAVRHMSLSYSVWLELPSASL